MPEQDLVNRLNLLLEVNASINSTRNLDELLTKITNVTSVVMQCQASSIALLDYNTEELVFQFVHGEASDAIKTFRVPVGEGISGWVAKYEVPLIVPDAQKDPRFNKEADKKSEFTTKSVICVPIKRTDRVIGIIQSLNKKDGSAFTDDDLTIFSSLANIAGIAIENAQLYQVLNERLGQLEEAKQRNEKILNQLKQSEEESLKLRELANNREGAFAGKLDAFRVENLVQMLSNDRKTGCLHLTTNEDSAEIYLDKGKLKHVSINGWNVVGIDAFYETICWIDGSFTFKEGEESEAVSLDKMLMPIMIEGLRRLDEANVLIKDYNFESVLKYSFDTKTELGEPSPEDTDKIKILKKVNGKKTIKELLKESTFDRYTFFKALKELDEEKMLEFI